jgi:hypothetical protein
MVVESLLAPARRDRDAAMSARLPLRPMSGYEEEFVETRRDDRNTARVCNEVLARCLVEPGRDAAGALRRVRALPLAERDRMLVELRRMSLGDEIHSQAICPRCSGVNQTMFSLADLPLDFEPLPERVQTDRAVLRLPTAGDQEALLEEPAAPAAICRTRLLARLLLRFDGRDAPFEEAFVHALSSGARRDLEAAIDRTLPDLSLAMNVACAHCGSGFTAPFEVAAFFLPK